MSTENIITIFAAIMGSGIVSAVISKFINDKNSSLEYITKERAQWRKDLKEYCSKLVSLSRDIENSVDINSCSFEKNKILRSLQLNLNPFDIDDINIFLLARAIVKRIDKDKIKTVKKGKDEYEIEEFFKGKDVDIDEDFFYRIEKLLKDDWERSKKEAKTNYVSLKILAYLFFSITLSFIIGLSHGNYVGIKVFLILMFLGMLAFILFLITIRIKKKNSKKDRETIKNLLDEIYK